MGGAEPVRLLERGAEDATEPEGGPSDDRWAAGADSGAAGREDAGEVGVSVDAEGRAPTGAIGVGKRLWSAWLVIVSISDACRRLLWNALASSIVLSDGAVEDDAAGSSTGVVENDDRNEM